ncbi:AAA family ATPase [Streptomyces sp. MUM 136J]|uniref:ATP-binding protein n=1 Tax=Streptomyces sp. MUM 136J TaxID=2791992 RepID=UPI001F039D1D|nr:LuxR family transcriptional regulator [Streptomyces sp. MUM 136J]
MPVTGRRGVFDPGASGGPAFVGRREELRLITDSLRTGPAVVFVEGGAGSGKSRLVVEALAGIAREGMPVLRGWCHPLREPPPFGPVIDALRKAAPHLSADAELSPVSAVLAPYLHELAERLPERRNDTGPRESTAVERQHLVRAVHELLGALAAVVLVVEDVHWADEATRELLLLLARNPPQGLRLIVTYRQQGPQGANVLGAPYRRPVGVKGADITLTPLTEEQVHDLAVSAIGPTLADVLARQLFERSGGLPLAAEADLAALAGRLDAETPHAGHPGQAHGRDRHGLQGAAVPRALQETVNIWITTLDTAATAVAQAAAVLDTPATDEQLAALTRLDDDELEKGLAAALETGVLHETSPGRYGFPHVLARQAVYDKILGPQRRRLHRRAAQALDRQEPPPLAQIAHHTRQLGDPGLWIPRAVSAADRAIELGDDDDAGDLLLQLLDEPALPPDRRAVAALALSRIATRRAAPSASIKMLRRFVADPAMPAPIRSEIRLNLGRARWNQGHEGAATDVQRAADELKDNPGLTAIALTTLGAGTRLDTTLAQDLAIMERAAAASSASTDKVAAASVLAGRITLRDSIGDPLARDLIDQLPVQSQDRDIRRECARALYNAADGALWRADDERSRALLSEAERTARKAGYQWVEAACDASRLELDYADGHWDDLDARIEALTLEADEHSALHAEALLIRTLLDLARGQWPRARKQLSGLLRLLHSTNTPQPLLAGIAAAGRLDLAAGDLDTAWNTVRESLDAVRHKGVWTWATDLLPTAVQAALGCGLRKEAQQLTNDAQTGIKGYYAPGAAAEVLWCQGLLSAENNPGSAMEHLDHASTRFQVIGRTYQAARITEQAGLLTLDAFPDTPGRAARKLQEALDTFTGLGATADAARCQQTLRDTGQQRPEPRGRRSYGRELSPRERHVAELLTTGATNQDIAKALSLSPRTAERHVANVLKKLHTTRNHMISDH